MIMTSIRRHFQKWGYNKVILEEGEGHLYSNNDQKYEITEKKIYECARCK